MMNAQVVYSDTLKIPNPVYRLLRVYAFDPSVGTELDTALINQVTLKVRWEHYWNPETNEKEIVQVGPVGEYLEVIDYDPASGCFYDPVDLNHPNILAQNGLAPSEGNPQFHQQMVYAVAMITIEHFERALGRKALWSPRFTRDEAGRVQKHDSGQPRRAEFVPRLRIYPHALRESNAYYSPVKKALLFGYFPAAQTGKGRNFPGGTIFTCLSHDIIAHETTHALLDGLHRYFLYPTNYDVPAFHEAFADLVALFQHFTYSEVLQHQIAKTRGDLSKQSLLGELAQQFGEGIGQYGALRSAIGSRDPETGVWEPSQPDPQRYDRTKAPHARGAILVAAVFDAFLTIYKNQVADLLRIATGGTGKLPEGDLHPDLVKRLAQEAASCAHHMLQMCIRALDYCPAVDITFGEYLRALISADLDMTPEDENGYRVALIEGFRRWGIYPSGVRTLSIDSLCWQPPTEETQNALQIKDMLQAMMGTEKRGSKANGKIQSNLEWNLSANRRQIHDMVQVLCKRLHKWLQMASLTQAAQDYLGLSLSEDAPGSIQRDRTGRPRFEVHSVRPSRRFTQHGAYLTDLVIVITQRRLGYFCEQLQAEVDRSRGQRSPTPDFILRGGCQLLLDLENQRVRYAIYKPIRPHLTSSGGPHVDYRLETQREYERTPNTGSLRETYLGHLHDHPHREPFALVHRTLDQPTGSNAWGLST